MFGLHWTWDVQNISRNGWRWLVNELADGCMDGWFGGCFVG